MSPNLGDGYDHRLDASRYLRGGRDADGKAYWICVECGKHHDYSVMVCSCYQPSDYDRALEKAVNNYLTAGIKAPSAQLIVDSSIQARHLAVPMMDPDISYVHRRVDKKTTCFYCLRERDEGKHTCSGCGGTRFIKEAS